MKIPPLGTRHGFTLVEVLLTTVLAAALLVALWSMLSMYSKVFETGHERTEQSQLARTLFDEISTDLQSVLQAPPVAPMLPTPAQSADDTSGAVSNNGSPASSGSASSVASSTNASSTAAAPTNSPLQPVTPVSAASSTAQTVAPVQPVAAQQPISAPPTPPLVGGVAGSPGLGGSFPANESPSSAVATRSLRPAGLFGTDTYLQIDVVQPVLPMTESLDGAAAYVNEPTGPDAGELRTITYSFEEVELRDRISAEPLMHLVRRELSWAEAHPSSGGRAPGVNGSAAGSAARRTATAATSAETEVAGDDPLAAEDPSAAKVPEVIYFALRYFDGATWSDHWDSIARKRLPTAIEVAMRLRAHDQPESSVDVETKPGVDAEKIAQWKYPIHRLLIPLEGTAPANVPAESTTVAGLPSVTQGAIDDGQPGQ